MKKISTAALLAAAAAPAAKKKPTQTDAQVVNNSTLAMYAQVWNSLDKGTRGLWAQLGAQGNGSEGDVVGTQTKISGYQTFIKVNSGIYPTSGAVMSQAPSKPISPLPLPPMLMTVTCVPAGAHLVITTQAYSAPVLIYAAPPVPAGQNNYKKGAFKLIGSLPHLTASNDLSDLYNAKFRGVTPGSKIALQIVGVSASGKRSAKLFVSGVTAFSALAAAEGTDTHEALKIA